MYSVFKMCTWGHTIDQQMFRKRFLMSTFGVAMLTFSVLLSCTIAQLATSINLRAIKSTIINVLPYAVLTSAQIAISILYAFYLWRVRARYRLLNTVLG